jgi:hypothetical protein
MRAILINPFTRLNSRAPLTATRTFTKKRAGRNPGLSLTGSVFDNLATRAHLI